MASIEDFKKEWHSDVPYILAHSSGSTGEPKEIHLLKKDMRLSARATNQRFCIGPDSVLALPLSVDYIAGKMMCVRAWEAGCRLKILDVSNRFALDERVDLLAVVPSQVDHLVEIEDIGNLVGNLIVGGASLSPQRAAKLIDAGLRSFVSYGMTETCSHVALAEVCARSLSEGYLYKAMPGVSFSTDQRSCLVVDAPEYSFGRLVTNDIVETIDGRTFMWRGRYDNVINSGGIKLPAEELEAEISKLLPGVSFYITAGADMRWGEIPVMVYEGATSASEQILQILSSSMDHRRLPRRLVAVRELPRTSNGKVRRLKF